MTVYVDVILLANFLLDYNLIAYTGVINQQRVSFLRIILATLLALSSLSLFFVEIKSLFLLLRIIYSLVIIYVAFSFTSIKQYVKNIIIFYFLNYVTAGVLVSYDFNFTTNTIFVNYHRKTTWYLLVISFIFANVITYIYKVIGENNQYQKTNVVKVKFRFFNQDYYANGLIDTGNTVESSGDQVPVVFIDKKLFSFEINEMFLTNHEIPFTYIMIKTINDERLTLVFRPEAFYLVSKESKQEKHVYLALFDNTKNPDFQVILNNKILN